MDKTQKLIDAKFGVFSHFLYGDPGADTQVPPDYDWSARVDAVDVDHIARTLHEMGAGYYFITIMQCQKYMIAPNATYDRIAGTKPGEACARRDLIMDLANALEKYHIDLYLYFTGDGPFRDEVIGPKFGFGPKRGKVTRQFVENWASVLKEYALRYGDKVKGWWMDGCYDYFDYTDELLDIYHEAMLAGNPDAIAAWNNGVQDTEKRWYGGEDFLAGEQNDFENLPKSAFVDGVRCHILAPIGKAEKPWHRWCKPGCAYTHEEMRDIIRHLHGMGVAVTVDMRINFDGTFDPEQVAVMTMNDL